MSRTAVALALAFLAALVFVAPAGAASQSTGLGATPVNGTHPDETTPDGPHVAAVFPNPVAAEDAGEHVVLAFPRASNLTGWTLTDGESTLSLPNATVSGRVAVTSEPNATRNLTDADLLVSNDSLGLANGGDEVRLLDGDRLVDEVTYGDAPDGEVGRRTDEALAWRPLGATDVPVVRTTPSNVRTFVLPDAPAVAVETLRGADDRILLAGYSFGSERVARVLERAASRGVEVRILLDDAPVGGITARQARTLDSLSSSGVEVEVLGGERARYDYHHPKSKTLPEGSTLDSHHECF